MIEELDAAREQFQAALDRYFILCSHVQDSSSLRTGSRTASLRQVDAEMALLASYESKLREARRAIGKARNYSLKLTLINLLPSEILLRIFQLFMAAQPCRLKDITRPLAKKPFLMYPDCLAHVCSRWRQIAITSPSMWVHVDLAICKPLHQLEALVDRVQTYAARSGGLPLRIHIAEPEAPTSPFDDFYVEDILRPIVGRMEGLEFNIRSELGRFHNSILRAILSSCTPQKFNKLTINSTQGRYNNFIGSLHEIIDAGEGDSYLRLSLLPDDIEAGLGHLTVLHLAGFFPKWTSVAYHGLVDLRLTSPHSIFWSSIKESELVNILRASPALRILYLKLEVTERHPDNTPITPVPLEHLEVLSIIIDDFWHREDEDPPAEAGKLLRLFAPGSRPLRFTFQTIEYANDRSFEEIKNFFMRSNIVKFCSQDAYPPLDELLSHARNLQTLVFRGCLYRDSSMDLVSQANQNSTSLHLRWDSWHMRDCEININDLSTIVRLYPVGELVLSGCTVYRNPPGSTDEIEIPEGELLAMFPLVRFIQGEEHLNLPDPTENWDVID